MRVLITGVYGFIGYSVAVRLLNEGHIVIGVDKVREALSPKGSRIQNLAQFERFEFHDQNLSDFDATRDLIAHAAPDQVVHFAGQYSVLHTSAHVRAYVEGNLRALVNVFEAARVIGIQRVIYASSTFVQDGTLPTSMYGATKQFAELCAHVYASQFGLHTVGLRFGSTYGPHMRPDVGIYQVAKRLIKRAPIDLTQGGFNYKTAFLYIDDAVEVVRRFLDVPQVSPYVIATVVARDEIRDLAQVLELLVQYSGIAAHGVGQLAPRQEGVVPAWACDALQELIGYAPATVFADGMKGTTEWLVLKSGLIA